MNNQITVSDDFSANKKNSLLKYLTIDDLEKLLQDDNLLSHTKVMIQEEILNRNTNNDT
tara:strand:+ start:500 stop:676 length:177 start_codon:yes stop_codon:yes gene_type:complete